MKSLMFTFNCFMLMLSRLKHRLLAKILSVATVFKSSYCKFARGVLCKLCVCVCVYSAFSVDKMVQVLFILL